MKRFLVDMDGVLADVYERVIGMEEEALGKTIDRAKLIGRKELSVFPRSAHRLREVGFFRSLPVMEGSIEGLKYLNDRYEVFIVSAAMEFPNSLQDKYEWLEEYFPFITWKQIILCGDKTPVVGDVMIDDHLWNLNRFLGQKCLFTQPHNMLVQDPQYTRVNSWKEIMELF